jgi:UTP--glucose-1-phosphate uridylyltransferase
MPPTAIDAPTAALLARYGFDEALLARLVTRLERGDGNAIRGRVEPPREGDVVALPAPRTPERRRLAAIGERAIAAGKVGAVILAGGMATRFGGVVKAGVPAVRGRTFLDLKVADLARLAERTNARVPCFAMTSFATHDAVGDLSRALATPRVPIECFAQGISLRVTKSGEPFIEKDGAASPYAPGHGDLTFALRSSGVMKRFRDAGGEVLVMSNVDNLGATLDPAIVGLHLERGVAVTAEVVRKEAGDKGGAPARVEGTVQIVESFRFPADFDQDSIPVFNTNTFVLDARAIDRDFDLTWFVVEKTVEGTKVIQFERLVGELTAFLPSAFVEVARHGDDGRFQPAKDPDELARRVPEIESLLRARGVID